jgi:signal transduction histidine kinase
VIELVAAVGWAVTLAVAAVVWRGHARSMELVARSCHELRGPLTAARLGLALGERGSGLAPVTVRAIDLELERAALALDDLARARHIPRIRGSRRGDEREPEDLDLHELLAESVEAWRAAALSRGVPLSLRCLGGPAIVRGDRLRLAQAIGNLIANALEHGAGPVEVRSASDAVTVRLEVNDGGPGLPAPVAELARRPRAGRGERGRGLAIASAVAEEHRGRLAAAPSERGARLVLELPASERGAAGPAGGAVRQDQAAVSVADFSCAGDSSLSDA